MRRRAESASRSALECGHAIIYRVRGGRLRKCNDVGSKAGYSQPCPHVSAPHLAHLTATSIYIETVDDCLIGFIFAYFAPLSFFSFQMFCTSLSSKQNKTIVLDSIGDNLYCIYDALTSFRIYLQEKSSHLSHPPSPTDRPKNNFILGH